ncbi:LysR family transcriptional regulator [Musicola keenii]|uniref:LysR family transcriptional regulator n=1 Tax=Musicola keenii TaxID=2884250 RepID=UPI00177B5CC3|nr:LysR family transcriptional regulator [Musicola keenii]
MHNSEIKYFLAVANTGSLSAASQQLFVAVSAISRQIQKLEERIGAPLFERHARGMVLTDAGQILENHVRKSMMDMEYAIAEIQGLKAVRRAFLRIACTDGMAFDLLPSLLTRFRQTNPSVTFFLQVGTAMQVSEMVRNGECDVAFQFSLSPERSVEVLASYPASVMLLMRPEHPLAQEQDIQMADLQAFPLLLPQQGTTTRQLFDLTCRMSGTFLEPVLSCNNLSTLYYFLLQTPDAVTACSHFSVLYRAKADGLMLKPVLRNPLTQRTLQIQTMAGKHRSAALNHFIDFVTDELSQENERVMADLSLS